MPSLSEALVRGVHLCGVAIAARRLAPC
jgi:hypothetical protein